jgi:hypothetical protein
MLNQRDEIMILVNLIGSSSWVQNSAIEANCFRFEIYYA